MQDERFHFPRIHIRMANVPSRIRIADAIEKILCGFHWKTADRFAVRYPPVTPARKMSTFTEFCQSSSLSSRDHRIQAVRRQRITKQDVSRRIWQRKSKKSFVQESVTAAMRNAVS